MPRGWWRGCGRLAESYRLGQGTPVDMAQAIRYHETAAEAASRPVASRSPNCTVRGRMTRWPRNASGRHVNSAFDMRHRGPHTLREPRRNRRLTVRIRTPELAEPSKFEPRPRVWWCDSLLPVLRKVVDSIPAGVFRAQNVAHKKVYGAERNESRRPLCLQHHKTVTRAS